ncbi:MAG TPA: hypothetical protein DCZ80_01885 [Legionellales bacterium]|nr:hypothetical protein [Legionellales bacterium]
MKKIFSLLILFYSFTSWAQLSASLEPNPAVLGQDLQLIIKKSEGGTRGLPDLSILENDFHIVGTQQSSSYQNVNGKSFHEYTWIIMLHPKHAGKIQIPSIPWGHEQTPALQLDVQATPTQAEVSARPSQSVFLTWEILPKHPRVHEQVKIKLKIYHADPLLDAKLTPPVVKNGLLFSLDAKPNLFEIINQRRYQVEQYRYILYPQSQGALEIEGPVLEALEYGMVPTPIHQALSGQSLKILPPADGQSLSQWLPVENLSYEELQPFSQKMGIHSGDTMVRKIAITAKGLPAQLIPDIQTACGQDCKVYNNPPKIDNQMIDGELFGKKIFEITYLPTKVGSSKIEPIQIPWFDTLNQKTKHLTIPAIPFEVFKAKESDQVMMPSGENQSSNALIYWGLILGFIAGGLLVWFVPKISWPKILENIQSFELRNYALKRACLKNQASQTRLALLHWAKNQHFPQEIRDLHDICRQIPDGEFKIEIKSLIAFLFSLRKDKTWSGQRLWRAFKQFKRVKSTGFDLNANQHGLNP